MPTPIRDVLIVGGGTAGWMAAAYLNRVFGSTINIRVVESKSIGIIGVGESSVNILKFFFDFISIPEGTWMPACNATFKFGLKFVNWGARPFYSPFEPYPEIENFSLAEWWLKTKVSSDPVDYATFTAPVLCDAQRSPRHFDGATFAPTVAYPYAYQFDATRLADFLQATAVGRGVEHILGDIVGTQLKPNGEIEAVQLATGERLAADLFVDCSGFRGLLINDALGEPFNSFSSSLLCDRAVAVQFPANPAEEGIEPYTTATALSAGWCWRIPLFTRIGTGYVYSSSFISEDEAERELAQHLNIPRATMEPLRLKMRVGRNRSSWVKNCVSIGLSSAFVEPLESTGIFFILYGLQQLISHFPTRYFDAYMLSSYNRNINKCIDGVRDFLILHYYASSRTDSLFWLAVKRDAVVPDDLRDKLELWRRALPNRDNINREYHGFPYFSYLNVLIGLGYHPRESAAALRYLADETAEAVFAGIKSRAEHLKATLPSHYAYLRALYAGALGSGEGEFAGSSEPGC
jgi:tryptophan 6-halogenase